MNTPTGQIVVFCVKAFGILVAYSIWAYFVYLGRTPADVFITGLLSLVSFLTGHTLGKSVSSAP